jgi:hypothetical protein
VCVCVFGVVLCVWCDQERDWAEYDNTDPVDFPRIAPKKPAASPKELALKAKLAQLLSQAKTANDVALGNMRTSAIQGARVPGISHACNTVPHNIQLMASPSDMSSEAAEAAAVTMRDNLVLNLIEMNNSPPETEEGVRKAQKALAQFANNNRQDRTKRGMARLLSSASLTSHLEHVKSLSRMSAASAAVDAALGYGTTASLPTLPPGVWDGSKGLAIGAASYPPAVDQVKHDAFGKGMFGASSAGITLKKLLQSGSKNPREFDIALFDFLGASPVWQIDAKGNTVQYDPFETFAGVSAATREAFVIRTGFLLEYTYDIRYASMVAHAKAMNRPIPPKPPTFLMGAFGQVQTLWSHFHLNPHLRDTVRS